ncbi:MAG: hypothetical protein J0L56_13990 [Chitinophagales bacterium]|nr:hypothetical protein [Chitinophagales bacterium]
MKKKLPLIALLFFLLACNRQTETDFFINNTYTTENVASVDLPRLFTSDGEITNLTLIRDFVERHTTQVGFQNNFLFGISSQLLDTTFKLKISFRADGSAVVERCNHFSLTSPLETYTASYTNYAQDILLVTETDSVTNVTEIGNCQSITEAIVRDLSAMSCIQVSNTKICSYKYSFPLKKSNNRITMPFIRRLVYSRRPPFGPTCGLETYRERNIFNPSGISVLTQYDTVVIQTKEVVLKKI